MPDSLPPKVDDAAVMDHLRKWEAAGGPSLERAELAADSAGAVAAAGADRPRRAPLRPRRSTSTWRRTSYSALIRAAEETGGVTSEPELSVRDDELADELADEPDDAEPLPAADEPDALASPMADLPSGAAFGSLVHGVLEAADPHAPDLEAELRGHVERAARLVAGRRSRRELAAALVPLHHTSLGPLADGLTLGEIGLADRLCELDFEIPLAGGDIAPGVDGGLADVGAAARRGTSPPTIRCALRRRGCRRPGSAASRCAATCPAPSTWCSGCPARSGPRYLVADYKTNWLGARRPAAHRGALRPAAAGGGDAALRLPAAGAALRRRACTATCAGASPATTRRGTSAASSTSTSAACAAPRRPRIDGHPAGVFSLAAAGRARDRAVRPAGRRAA